MRNLLKIVGCCLIVTCAETRALTILDITALLVEVSLKSSAADMITYEFVDRLSVPLKKLLTTTHPYVGQLSYDRKAKFDQILQNLLHTACNTFHMVTLSTADRKPLADIVERNQRRYAKKHHYGYTKYTEILDTSRPAEWSKILALQDTMNKVKVPWLLWIDDDILITNPDISLESIVSQYGSRPTTFVPSPTIDLIITRDAHYLEGVPINNGIFLIRTNDWAKKFLADVWKFGSLWDYVVRGQSLLEQQTMTDLLGLNANRPERKNSYVTDHVSIIPQRVMNSFLRSSQMYDDPEESKWQPGDFAAHVTGMPLDVRTRVIKDLWEQLKTTKPIDLKKPSV